MIDKRAFVEPKDAIFPASGLSSFRFDPPPLSISLSAAFLFSPPYSFSAHLATSPKLSPSSPDFFSLAEIFLFLPIRPSLLPFSSPLLIESPPLAAVFSLAFYMEHFNPKKPSNLCPNLQPRACTRIFTLQVAATCMPRINFFFFFFLNLINTEMIKYKQ